MKCGTVIGPTEYTEVATQTFHAGLLGKTGGKKKEKALTQISTLKDSVRGFL